MPDRVTAQPARAEFVRREGTHLAVDGRPFYFLGGNTYYLMTHAADPGRRRDVDEVLQSASALGLKVIRTWAFSDGDRHLALQPSPGHYDERVFQGLDYVLWKAERLGLRVILVLVNSWDQYGGMKQYVEWSPTAQSHDDFYSDESARTWYRRFVTAVVTRKNTLTGRLYRDDPTIAIWALANEPRARRSRQARLVDWIAEMSAFLKSLDPNHLVTTGSEGLEAFVEIHRVPTVDLCTVHIWPDTWRWDERRTRAWLQERVQQAHTTLQKPLIVEEFGKFRDTRPPVPEPPIPTGGSGRTASRDQFYGSVLGTLAENRVAGALFWALYHSAYCDYDGFGVYYPEDRSSAEILTSAARAFQTIR